MTPHVMILPLPLEPVGAQLAGVYDPEQPLQMWMMAPSTPVAHLHVHFPEPVHRALMSIANGDGNPPR